MDTPYIPEDVDPDNDLDARILAAEKAVIARDERVRRQANALVQGVRARTGSSLVIGAAAATGVFLVSRLLRRLRPARNMPQVQVPPPGLLSRLLGLAALIWPLIPPGLRARLPPGAAPLLAALGLPLLTQGKRPGELIVPPIAVPRVDLQRYAGRWFEIAGIPGSRPGSSEASTVYSLEESGIAVVRRSVRRGREIVTHGVARAVEVGNAARLQVSFAPTWLRWLPLMWEEHWVLQLDPACRHALVGTPDRRHLWLMARTPEIADVDCQHLIDRARAQGYRVDRIRFTPQ